VSTEPLLPLDWPEPEPQPQEERLSPDRRRTLRQRDAIARGVHPLNGFPLHAWADSSAQPGERTAPFTCGSCRFRVLVGWHRKTYPKCVWDASRVDQDAGDFEARTLDEARFISHSTATDVRAWWPACVKYEAGDAGLSPDASRVIPDTEEAS
jgi:hypothetical protein